MISLFLFISQAVFDMNFIKQYSTCQLPTSDKSSHNMASSNPKKDRITCFQDGSSMMCPRILSVWGLRLSPKHLPKYTKVEVFLSQVMANNWILG